MEYIEAKTILTKCKSTDWFGTDYNMNIYRGCCHGCIYCDSRSECYRIENFDNVRAKKDVLILLPSFGVTLRQNQREYFFNKLDDIFPESDLRKKYIKAYGNSYECIVRNVGRLWKVFESECHKYGIIYKMKDIISAYKSGYEMSQLSFF